MSVVDNVTISVQRVLDELDRHSTAVVDTLPVQIEGQRLLSKELTILIRQGHTDADIHAIEADLQDKGGRITRSQCDDSSPGWIIYVTFS